MDLNYDSTADATDNCVTLKTSCVVTVTATDASGDATAASPTTTVFVEATVTITLKNVDEKPTFGEVTEGTDAMSNAMRVDAFLEDV